LSWLVYVVRSMLICLRFSHIMRRVPSLPLYCPLINLSRWFMQQAMVHISKFGTLMATDCDRPANLAA
jgi:hypothetical protein